MEFDIILSDFEQAVRQAGMEYKEWSGNIKIKIAGRGKDESTYSANILTDKYGNNSMMETDEGQTDGTWIDVTYSDTEINKNTTGVMFADFIKPELTYLAAETIVDKDNKILTVIFSTTDKYFDAANSSLAISDLTLMVDGETVNVSADGNTLTDEAVIENGTRIGTKYTLVVKNLQKAGGNDNDGFSYSGIVSIAVPANKFKDYSGNSNDATTLTIGVDEKDGNPNLEVDENGKIIDIVDPVWKMENINIDYENNGVIFDLIATDKYYLSNTLTSGMTDNLIPNNKMLIYVDGALDGDTNGNGVLDTGETPIITKTLIATTDLETVGTGVKYTIKLGNWDADKYSGTTKIIIPENTIVDDYDNTSVEQEFIIGHIDFIKPEIKIESSTVDAENKTQTIEFTAIDKFMDISDLITIPDETNPDAPDEITVYVDGEIATGITRTLTNEPITELRNGTTHTIGHKYTLVISNFEQVRTSINRTREFSDWSGTVKIEIAEGAVKDIQVSNPNGEVAGGNINDKTMLNGSFIDLIKPNITYEYSESDIVRNHENKEQRTFTMVFDITDKYFKESAFANALTLATTDEEKLDVLKQYLTIWVDGQDITNVNTVTKKIVAIENVTATMNKTVFNAGGDGEIVTGGTYTIGKRFTLEISNLEQDPVTAEDEDFLNYSGVISVAVKEGAVIDQGQDGIGTNPNKNLAGTITVPSITSGVTTPDGSGDEVIVDLVDPLWQQAETAEAKVSEQYGKITLKGTDKYLKTIRLQPSDITITVISPNGTTTVNGANASSKGMTLTITEDTTVTLDYGKQYDIVIRGYTKDAYQVKLTLADGIMEDDSGNTSQETEFVLFSSLASTYTESSASSEFLAQNKTEGQTIPQRQYIEQIIFKDNLTGINDTKWDVSQLKDGTIWAWYTTRTADDGTTLYTVYIGSRVIINGNIYSRYLFSYIGYNSNCKITGNTSDNEIIENLDLLHVESVIDMAGMFQYCGYANMKSLNLGTEFETLSVTNMQFMFDHTGYTSMTTFDLGDNFDTSNVTSMHNMFSYIGYTAMTSLDLGDKFDTGNVDSMMNMFTQTGYTAMTSLNLGDKFDTGNVVDMMNMFSYTGYTAMTGLDLGDKFDTRNVSSMNQMFCRTGYTAMISLDLGDKFDTRNVIDMYSMFSDAGYMAMTKLDLGDKFYTTNATNMEAMFAFTGNTAMTVLDLGPAFTNIAEKNNIMFMRCGKDGELIIYAPESIYQDMNNFKLDTDSTTTISYTRGTINPIYRPKWKKVSSTLDKTEGVMDIVVEGSAYNAINRDETAITTLGMEYSSDVVSTLDANNVKVYIDGELAENVNVAVNNTGISTYIPEASGPLVNKVQYTIRLSNLEEAVRQNGKNFREWSGNVTLQLEKGSLKDMYGSKIDGDGNFTNIVGNSNLAMIDIDTSGTTTNILVKDTEQNSNTTNPETEADLFADIIKPEFTYEYSKTTIGDGNHGDTKIVTVAFDVTDKYFKQTNLETDANAELIKVLVDGVLPGDKNGNGIIDDDETLAINKTLTKTGIFVMNKETKEITLQTTDYTIQLTEQKVGERYELVITGLQQSTTDAFDYSGIVTLGFGSEIIEDLSGNKNDSTTITIGKDEPETDDGNNSEEVVDVVDPVWQLVESSLETGIIKLRAQDKFFETTTLTTDDIIVYVNSQPSEEVTKTLTGPTEVENGVEYELQLGNVTLTGGEYTTFEPSNKDELNQTVPFKYKAENGGTIKLGIAKDTIKDQYGNMNIYTEFDVGIMDDTKPEVYEVQKIQDADAKTETIIFNVTDRNWYTPTAEEIANGITNEIITDEIKVWLDGEEVDSSVIKEISYKPIKLDIDGEIGKSLGHQYTLIISSIVETQAEFVGTGREYRELSGTLEIRVDKTAVKDINDNTLHPDSTTISDFVDYIRPEVKYKYTQSSQGNPGDIDYEGKTFTMVFEVLDKYIKESTLKNKFENATTEIEKQAVIEEFLQIVIDSQTIDWSKVNKALTITEITAETAFNKTIGEQIVNDNHVIGYRYELVLSNLEQLQILEGDQYLNYSGVVTTTIAAGIAKDTSGNSSIGTTITSGIDIVGDVQDADDTEVTVDVVDPLWEKVSTSANAIDPVNKESSTATITIKGTDKYYQESILTQDNIKDYIKVYAHTGSTPGTEATDVTSDVNITVSTATPIYKTGTTDQQIGDEYTLTITGFAQDVNQIKIAVQPGAMTDQSGNTNKVTEMIVYNTLRLTKAETQATSGFLGETSIERQKVQKVVFVNNISGSTENGVQKVWDVSAAGDNSILAWYKETSAPYTVYIGSNYEIFGNQDSSYLFSYIGYDANCSEQETISNLNLLNVSSVKDMSCMFRYTGYTAMTTLNLGSKFDTSNVTNMQYMFHNTGYNLMTSIKLGEQFNTVNVTNMQGMFYKCGNSSLETIDLGNKFNTTNVTDMQSMFTSLGDESEKFETLNLGDQFDTSNVTNMSGMFSSCGRKGLTALNLGNKFNTKNVTDMSNMFASCGYEKLTEIDLGDNFDTSNVTNMNSMFSNFGNLSLTKLDLGEKFNTSNVTDMSSMFTWCGREKLTEINLGNKFDTSNVTNMNRMFRGFSYKIQKLDLGEKFYTTNVTDMEKMFTDCGTYNMTILDLGPAFTNIAEAHSDIFVNCGGSENIIKAPESIYQDMKHFKLNTDSTTTIEISTGTIDPIYKPEWIKETSYLTIDEENVNNSKLTIVVEAVVDSAVYANANKTVTPHVTEGNDETNQIYVTVDGESAESITQTIDKDTSEHNRIFYRITLSNFGETVRQSGKNFKEWAGNVAIQFAKGTLTDYYGNKNMQEIDINPSDLTIKEKIEIKDDTELDANAKNNKMFSDFIEPEFTYEYHNTEIEGDTDANTVIDYVNNKVTVVFDVTDKYFKESALTANDITVYVDEDVNANSAIEKELTKTGIFVMNKETKEVTLKQVDYTIDETTEQITGERYQLVITGLESSNGVGYSGPITLAFPAGNAETDANGNKVLRVGVMDKSGNLSKATSITIGIDEPSNHPEHNESVIVDVVNPIWVGLRDVNSIDRTTDTVSIKVLGIDKYYKTNTLTTNDITVYADLDGNGTIEDSEIIDVTKNLTSIEAEELLRLAEDESLANYDDVKVGYTLTLTGFGDISGKVKVKIADETIEDQSGNKNMNTDPIFAGNIQWVENNEPLESSNENYPRYDAFREDVVDFIDPIITYTYSTVEIDTDGDGIADTNISANPDIDYTQKRVTVQFKVKDKYLLSSDLMKSTTDADGNEIQIPNNISVVVDGTTVYDSSLENQNYQVVARISLDSPDFSDGEAVYTLVISNLQQEVEESTNTTPANGNGFDFSGPMQLVFNGEVIDDTSGNKNSATTISLETHVDGEIVDVVDPIVKYESSSIDRTNNTVTVQVKAEDKYLATQILDISENLVQVKVLDENGNEITGHAVIKDITLDTNLSTAQAYIYNIVLSNFGVYEGKTSVIIPADVVKDSSGNGNIETEILVGNSTDTTAFKDSIVDFTKPIWEYETSTINRNVDANGVRNETGTVTLEVKGTDIYFDNKYFNNTEYQLDLTKVKVYINGVENTSVTKAIKAKEYIEETRELATDYSRVLKGVKYTLELGNFGTNEGTVKIEIPENAIRDTSINGNILTQIDVGNEEWIETVGLGDETENAENPKYTAFRNDIVDFIKPVIKYQYEENINPILDRTNETVSITFTVTDTNFLESNIGLDGIKVYIDNKQVYGTGVDADITASLSTPTATEANDGLKYTLTLSGLEQNVIDTLVEVFERHSGVIKIVFAENQISDSSGNKNDETTIIVDNDNGDSETNGIIVDFVNPNIYYQDKYLNWEENYALITLRATDRFYDINTALQASDIKLYEKVENDDGTISYIDITNNFTENIKITKSNPLTSNGNIVGYDYTIRLDDFNEEFKMKIVVAAGAKDAEGNILHGIGDTSGNLNDATDIFVDLDNRRPTWDYVSTDSTKFESDGTISFNIKGVDKFLDLENSDLEASDIRVLKDGVDITNNNITVIHTGNDEDEKSKSYKIDVTGLTEMGTYSLVIAQDTLVDEFENKSAATTISFSNSVIATNTDNYINVTYHVTPDMETVHKSYVHELMSANTTGTNFENTTYRPSTLAELFNNGENPLFAEPMYVPSVDGYTVNKVYAPKSFAGWAVCDENGKVADDATVYGLYDEIPNTVTNLKAVWQDATIVFVSTDRGNNSNDGKLPEAPVKDLKTAYGLLNSSGTAENNIIVIMDKVEHDDTTTLSGNATITSIYAGVDYRSQGAELKVSSNMIIDGDLIFDNIELYASSSTVNNGRDYVGNGNYSNMLISNYSGDITLGRGITTPSNKYTFGAIIGGNYKTQDNSGEQGTHTIRVEAGKYNNIIAGTTSENGTTDNGNKSVTHKVIIGNMRDTAVSRNDKLIITGYVTIGENETSKVYPSGTTTTNTAANKIFADVIFYSGTITGENKFAKSSEDVAIYLRAINTSTDGISKFEMYGGLITGDIYGGSRVSTIYETEVFNTMKFYGGQVTGDIFGQGINQTFTGSSEITLQGNFTMTGNIFGGPNVTTTTTGSVGSGNSKITVNSISTTINGNIYGGGKAGTDSTGVVVGNSEIILNSGMVSNIYGSGYNCGNTGEVNITIENGTVAENIYGGAYHNQARTISNILVLGGIVNGNIYGGNNNSESQLEGDTYFQKAYITIGDTDTTKSPTINGNIYGGGKYDKVDIAEIRLIECANIISVFGGSDTNAQTLTANIYLQGMTVNEIYGGADQEGTVSVSNIYLQSGTATDVYGGGYKSDSAQSNITLEGTATVTSIFGGANSAGTVRTATVTLKSGTITNVFGGGNNTAVGTANVKLEGATLETIHGGSKDAGVTTTTNVTLQSGTVTNVFGGGIDVGVTTANVKQQGAIVTNIYGGSDTLGTEDSTGGDNGTTNIDILDSTVENVYGGNYLKGTTRYTNINIHGTSTITGELYGGGYKSAIGKEDEKGSTTINIAGGTIKGDINGGSKESIVYGNTNIKVGSDVATELTAGNINIIGTIYGAGSTTNNGEVTVIGNTNITMDNNATYPITYFTADGKEKSIYGSGNGGAKYSNETDNSTIHIKDFGTAETPYLIKSIENTGNLYIGNSAIELVGALNNTTNEIGDYYTLNTITNALTIYDNTTLYTQRGFNKVGGFYSYVNQKTTKATVEITDGVATTNVDNRLYTLEGVNLIFAKKEVTLANKASLEQSDWGKVTGMSFFGVYKNTSSGKEYDLSLFKAGTYVEGQYNSNHNINKDGFYTNIEDANSGTEVAQIIETTNYTNYCDWIINAPTINYEVDLIASTYGQKSVAELLLNYKYATDYTYAGETVYTVNQVSSNALKPGIEIVNKENLSTISADANNKFGLTMETTKTGWQQQELTNIYSANTGSFDGDTVYTSDSSETPSSIKFKVYNSLNITEERDLGLVTIILTGQQPINETGTEAYTFKVAIAVNLQTIVDELKEQYTPSFTDRTETELSYTTDSRVDLSYLLYKDMETTPYETDDYRVISTTVQLPIGTKLTMKDYGQGDSLNKVYYYQVASNTDYYSTETINGTTRYLYKLSKFTEMGSTNSSYVDSTIYYHSDDKYVLEKYDISIDFINSNINTDKVAQETYMELRNSAGNVKYDNGDKLIKYNLYAEKNAVATETISNEGNSYSVVETLQIPIDISASILEQSGIMDTKYYNQIAGIAVQIVGENNIRIKTPELQNFKLINNETGEEFSADSNGVIRMPIIEGLGSKTGKYTLSITQANVTPGAYKAQVMLYTADDGKYYGTETELEPLEFNVTFISRLAGLLGVEAKDRDESSRIINQSTGLNLVAGNKLNNAIDMVIGVNSPTNETNIRVELYKRNKTYTDLTDETTYTGTNYTLVDIKDYLQGTWETPETYGLTTPTGNKEYIVSPQKNYETPVNLETITFQKAIVRGISTGEYKLVFKAYSDDTLLQTFSKTFMVTP